MTLELLLRMGRVSNLPTVWTNVLVGLVLSGASPDPAAIAVLVVAASLLYVAGMVLNDVCDAEIDARERPARPIPSGLVSIGVASRWGHTILIGGVAIAAVGGITLRGSVWPGVAAAITAGLIVLYDRHHKGNPLAPLVMGMCRMGVLAMAGAWAAPAIDGELWACAALLCSYVLGLTYVARFESGSGIARAWPRVFLFGPVGWALGHAIGSSLALVITIALAIWVQRAIGLVQQGGPHIRTAVVSLIAGISLLDASWIAAHGHTTLALLAVAAFLATLALQRRVAGT